MYNSGRRGKRANDGYGIISQADRFNQTEYPIPIVTSFAVTNGSYVPLDDTAASTAGGQTIVVYGSGFAPGATVMVGGSTIGAVTYLDQGRLTFTSPANSSGSYTIIVINANGGTGILVPGLVYSGVPTWSTSAGSVGSVYETTSVSSTFVATGDAPMTYSVLSGSLPPGTSLSTTGVLSGSAPVESGSTTYSFTIRATDGQLQDTDRSFSLTVNTDVITWSSPTNNQVISSYEYAPISNVTASATSAAGYSVVYSSNTTPTGISLNATTGVISGTANTVGNTYTRLTATANTTGRSAIRDVVFNVNQDVVTWSTPTADQQYSLSGGSAMSPVSLSATSAAGFGVQYSANALPSGVSLSGSTISGTPDTAQTVYTLLTATANTTNRSATRTISWVISLGDIYWKNTSLALNATPTSTPFNTDLSNNNTMLTVVGDTKPSNFDPYQEGYYSTTFSSSNYLTVTSPSIAMGTGDFTIEFWMYFTGTDGTRYELIDTGTSTIVLYRYSNNALSYFFNGADRISLSGFTAAAYGNRWLHFAISRVSGSTKMFINGSQVGSTYTDTNSFTLTSMIIGYSPGAGSYWAGQVSNFRILAGTGLYSTTFTPPTTPLTAVANTALLLFQSNRIIDKSPRNYAVPVTGTLPISQSHPFNTPTTVAYNTQYSTYFDGTGDYLSLSSNTAFALSGDYTIEAWVFRTDSGTQRAIVDLRGGSNLNVLFYMNSSNQLVAFNSSSTWISSTGTIPLNQWTHVAICRSGTSVKLFINGVNDGTATNSDANVSVGSPYIGRQNGSTGNDWLGNISNVRIVKGQALYTGNFTPATSSLTISTVGTSGANVAASISGTVSLLTCQNSTIIDNSTNAFTITSNGDARPVAISPFTQTTANTTAPTLGSAYFAGTGDYLSVPHNAVHWLSNLDFTIQAWFYTTKSGEQSILNKQWQGTSAAYASYNIYIEAGNTLRFLASTSGGAWEIDSGSTSTVIKTNTWYHVAVTRSGSTFRLFVNGVVDKSVTNSGTLYNHPDPMIIGAAGALTGYTSAFQGYISDIQLIRGTALYTSNFVPPQAPLTAVANTQLLTCQTNGNLNNNQFVDSSSFNNNVTRYGNTSAGTFSPYSPNGWSTYFNGSSDYQYLPTNAAFAIGTADFTLEMWVMPTGANLSWTTLFAGVNYGAQSDWGLYGGDGNGNPLYPMFMFTGSSTQGNGATQTQGTASLTGYTKMTIGQWNHIAVSRVSGTARMFLNGTQTGPSVNASTWSLANTLSKGIGGGYNGNGNTLFTGYISNIRLLSGTGLYSANFTPPTAPLTAIANTVVLTCQSNKFEEVSRNNFTITSGGAPKIQAISPFGGSSITNYYSTYFNTAANSLTYSNNAAGPTGTEDFTWEAWWYFLTQPGGSFPRVFESTTASAFQIYFNGSTLTIGPNGGSSVLTYALTSVNQWVHLCVTRSGSAMRLFVNGVLRAYSASGGTNFASSTSGWRVLSEGGSGPHGLISNMRVVRGSVVPDYVTSSTTTGTTIFIPPTSPLTAIANTALLAHQSSTQIDSSGNGSTITTNATNIKILPVSPFTPPTPTTGLTYSPTLHSGSMYLDGTSDYLTVASNPAYTTLPASGNFTIEGWFYFTDLSIAQQLLFTQRNSGAQYCPYLIWTSTSSILLYVSSNNGSWDIVNSATLASGLVANQWYHFAYTRNGSTFRFFVNGVQTYTFTSSAAFTNTNTYNIGMSPGETNTAFKGYISDHRFINGVSLYNANFVPPTAPATPVVYSNNSTAIANTAYAAILVSGTSGGIIDAHGTNILETVGDTKLAPESPFEGSYYSNYFDGTGDYLTVPNNSGLYFTDAGNHTFECWVNVSSFATTQGIIWNRSGSAGWSLVIQVTTGYPYFVLYTPTAVTITSSIALTLNAWNHIALVRSSSVITMYLNGVNVGTVSNASGVNENTQVINIGSQPNGGNPLLGYISNVRFVKGTAVYTSNFTPPTAPLTAISGTSLLTCQSNKFVDNSSNAFTITKNGDAAVKTFNPFKRNTGQSIYFDGTGDSLFQAASPNYTFGTGDFTIEFWINFTSTTNRQDILWISTAGAATDRLGISWNLTAGNLTYYISPTVGNAINAAWTPTTGQWYHIALCRSSGNTKLFINGTQSGSTYTDSRNYNSQYALYVGQDSTGLTSMFNGYLRDLRITRYARYTSNNQVNLTSTFEVK